MKTITNLHNLFETDFRHLPEKVIRDFEATEEVQLLRREIKEKIPQANWSTMREELLSELQKLLDIKLQPIWIESWKSHQDVSREINMQLDSESGETAILALSDHEIRSSHSPSLLVQIKDRTYPLRAFVGLTFNLSNVSLKIQHGEIQQIISGAVNGSGFLQYQNATLIEQEFLDFDISGKIGEKTQKAVAGRRPIATQEATAEQAPPALQSASSAQTADEPVFEETENSLKTNMVQFIIGVSIALVAVFLFWQLK